LKIRYANAKVEKYFSDWGEMRRKLPMDWVRTLKKHIDRLKAAETFGDFLALGLGHPEPLKAKDLGKYSVRVSGNVRLIIEPVQIGERIELSIEIIVEGVVDYHGGKDDWFIS